MNQTGPWLRKFGQKLYKMGARMQGDLFQEDRLVPSQRCVPVSNSVFPKLLNSEWVAPNCTIIGDVQTGKFSSMYHGVTLRGDSCRIRIGNKTVIQDNSLLMNSETGSKQEDIQIGDRVVIGTNCSIDTCRIDDNAVISSGATVHKGCHVQANSCVAAGAVIPPNTTVPSGQIYAGNPAKYLRDIKPEELIAMRENCTELRELSNVMVEATEKTHLEFLADYRYRDFMAKSGYEDIFINDMRSYAWWSDTRTDEFGVEEMNTAFDEYEMEDFVRHPEENVFEEENMDLYYESDMSNYPDALKIYGENYEKYDQLRKKFENEIPGESSGWPDNTTPPHRPGAMRAWTSKWDPDFNKNFRRPGAPGFSQDS